METFRLPAWIIHLLFAGAAGDVKQEDDSIIATETFSIETSLLRSQIRSGSQTSPIVCPQSFRTVSNGDF
jgi:hypothetical protein